MKPEYGRFESFAVRVKSVVKKPDKRPAWHILQEGLTNNEIDNLRRKKYFLPKLLRALRNSSFFLTPGGSSILLHDNSPTPEELPDSELAKELKEKARREVGIQNTKPRQA